MKRSLQNVEGEMKKIIKLDENSVAIIENNCVSIVQQLFSEKSVIVIGIDDIKQILKEYKGMKR